MPIKCAGCNRDLEVGDRYIEDTPSGFMGEDSGHDELIAEILGGKDGKIYYCDNCTIPGGEYMFETYYGDDD
jgi:hypothetical protein